MHAASVRSEGSRLEYLEYVLQKDAAGRYRAIDWYQLSRGELFSTSVGGLRALMSDPKPALLKRLFGLSSVDGRVVEQFASIAALQRSGKYAEAVGAIDKLPEHIAHLRIILTTRASDASLANMESEYRRTLSVLGSKYGDDASIAFMLLDHYFYQSVVSAARPAKTSEREHAVEEAEAFGRRS